MEAVNEITNDLLGYDGLKIIQRPDMFNFSLDSTLLADFVHISAAVKTIMDFGSGNAPIPLFLSLKTKKPIIGVEIQQEAYDLGKRSVAINGLQEQITMLNADIKELHQSFSAGTFDLIVCNPPFFKYHSESNVNKNDYLTIARHEVKIDLKGILSQAKWLLSNQGALCMIHRADRFEELILLLHEYKFSLKRMRFVYPKRGKDAIAVLIEAKAGGHTGSLSLMEPLVVYGEDGE
jgi:tRNA1Val (adenine37-N6)-methyltransferase